MLPEVEGGAEVGPQTRRPSPALSTGSLATVRGSHTREEWRQPAQKAEDFAPPPSYPHSAVFYAVVSDEILRS